MPEKITIPALKVHQWLPEWDSVQFGKEGELANRIKPRPYFLLFTIKARTLKKLSKVYPRRGKENEIGIQRKHDPERSTEITRYIKTGYPLSDLVKGTKTKVGLEDLQMPGWLPTSVVANILVKGTKRGSKSIKDADLIKINENGTVTLTLPEGVRDSKWDPDVPPIEIIDGQHRLWAFDKDDNQTKDFELPVVAFIDLDITWQAYLFYTINVKPKKINRSLAYDLYPLLRVQEWLDKSPDTALVYRETRAQEITEILWSYDNSPWKNRINLTGDVKMNNSISQAAFIRSLIASFIKTTTTKGLGGLLGAKLDDEFCLPLSWNRTQQAAFIVFIWQSMYDSVKGAKTKWVESLRKSPKEEQLNIFVGDSKFDDVAFWSRYALISTDQGVRGFMHIINDIVYLESNNVKIRELLWSSKDKDQIKEEKIATEDLKKCISDIKKSDAGKLISEICGELSNFDWRTSSEPNLSPQERKDKMVFKGSSGYKQLRLELLHLLSVSKNKRLATRSNELIQNLGYAEKDVQ
jgi:DGQHR domain-containing protein